MVSLEELLSSIRKKSDISAEKLDAMIEDKCLEFSGMITKEAAAHLVARDIGISLPKTENSRLQIKNIVPDMRNVNIMGRIIKISPINIFEKKSGDKGRVVNIFISDSTGYIRVPLWNDQVKIVEDEIVKIGDAVQIFGGSSKENIYGEVEISIGKSGGLRKLDDEYVAPSLESVGRKILSDVGEQVKIAELVPGNFEIRGTIVQVFRGNFIFETDAGEKALVISCLMDDVTGDVRVVFFRNLAEQVSGLTVKDLESIDANSRLDFVKKNNLGKEIAVVGKVKKNKFFDSLELIVDSVKDLNALEESKRIVEELEQKIGV